MHILVTGGLGWTAHAILLAVRRFGYEVTVFDLPTAVWGDEVNELVTNVTLGSVEEFDAVYEAMSRVDAVVHLAVATGKGDYKTPDKPFSINVKGTYNVYEAARIHNVQKVVLMSEAAVHVPYAKNEIVDPLDVLRTANTNTREHLYDLTKSLQEHIAHDYATAYGLTSVVLRPGHIVDGRERVDPHGKDLQYLEYLRGGWVCRYDVATAVLKAIQLEFDEPYNAYHVVGSLQAWGRFNMERTENELEMIMGSRFEEFV